MQEPRRFEEWVRGGRAESSTAAAMVHVKHKAYAGTEAASTYATLARSSSGVWKVVSDDTAP